MFKSFWRRNLFG